MASAKFTIKTKYVVMDGYYDEVKTFDNQAQAQEFAASLNSAYQSGIVEGQKIRTAE